MTDAEKRQCWETPKEFYDLIEHKYHPDIDVCAIKENAKCIRYITPEEDGLQAPWFAHGERCAWCNPGFGNLEPWVYKAYKETSKHPMSKALVLAHVSFAEWFKTAVKYSNRIYLLSPRLQFVPFSGIRSSSNSRDNILIVFQQNAIIKHSSEISLYDWRLARQIEGLNK